jgi:hypothetical protein
MENNVINLKYKDVPLTLDEETGKFSSEDRHESLGWLAMKRHIDAALKTKYTPVQALYAGYNNKPKAVTITWPVIGSNSRVWITDESKKRETVSIDCLISMECKDEFFELCANADALKAKLRKIGKQIDELKRADMPQPIVKP